jgi:glutathione S-transferase
MYKLFYSPGACSMAIHVVLNELNQPVELIRATIGDPGNIDQELHKVNPRNQVPVLVEDGKPILEGGAMITYLCDKHPSDLMPKSGYERAQALQWLMFGNATLHVGYSKAAFVKRNGGSDELFNKACEQIQGMWDQIEASLASSGKPYLCGDKVTAGDILITVIANWGFLGVSFNFGPKTKALLKSVSSRPAYQKALTAEQVEYKAAA